MHVYTRVNANEKIFNMFLIQISYLQKLLILIFYLQKLNSRCNTLLRDITDMKEMCTTDFSNYEYRQRKITSHYSDLSNKIQSFKETTNCNTTTLYDKTYNTLDTLQSLVDNSLLSVKTVADDVSTEVL